MTDNQRTGKRKKRYQKVGSLQYRQNYYLIVTDTEKTEKNYIEGLKSSLPSEVRDKIVIRYVNEKTNNMVDKCLEVQRMDAQYRDAWIIFDKDEVDNFDQIITSAERKGISVAWSNPCIEIWFLAYFGRMPITTGSVQCCNKLEDLYMKKTGRAYNKSDPNIYHMLNQYGDETKAIQIAENKYKEFIKEIGSIPSRMNPSSTLFILVRELKRSN